MQTALDFDPERSVSADAILAIVASWPRHLRRMHEVITRSEVAAGTPAAEARFYAFLDAADLARTVAPRN